MGNRQVCFESLSYEVVVEVEIPLSVPDRLVGFFLSTQGRHIIVSYRNGENFYVNTRDHNVVPLKKLKVCI